MHDGHKLKIPLCLSKKCWQARINKENCKKDGVNNGETGEKLGEGGEDIITGENNAGQAVGDDTKNANTGHTITLNRNKVLILNTKHFSKPQYTDCTCPGTGTHHRSQNSFPSDLTGFDRLLYTCFAGWNCLNCCLKLYIVNILS